MLNPFPIQWLALLAYALLRLFVGGILLYLGFTHLRYREQLKQVLVLSWWPYGTLSTWIFLLAELCLGTLMILGAYTQYAALVIMLMSIKLLVLGKYFTHRTIPTRLFYVLLFGAALSLFITGAGVLAVDLPI